MLRLEFVWAVLGLGYLTGAVFAQVSSHEPELSSAYTHSASPLDGYTLYWNLPGDGYFHIAIDARTQGWVGFGIAQVLAALSLCIT